jgi:hypothetical protein
MQKIKQGLILSLLITMISSCTARESDGTSFPSPTANGEVSISATVTPEPATTTPPATPTEMHQKTVTAQPTGESPIDVEATAPAPLFPGPPLNRSPYAEGLVESSQTVLESLRGAPIYHIAIDMDDSLTQITGRQTVYYTNEEDVNLDEVYFHLHANLLDGSIRVSDLFVDGVPIEPELIEGDTAMRIPLGKTLQPGKPAVIDMRFETFVPTDIGRNYGVLAYYAGTLALAHFYPMLAVYDHMGWNTTPAVVQGDITYSDAAFYLVEATAPADLTIVAAGVEIAREEKGDRQVVRFAAGPARDFFLSASPDYRFVSRTIGETTLNSYAPEGLQDGAEFALHVAAAALETFNGMFGEYPYTELDIVTTPTSALGIEYPGIIVGTVNMYDLEAGADSGVPVTAILESTTAHEVAHQWFYNVVGNDQLDEPWLDEALVSYLTYRYFLEQHGKGGGEGYFGALESRWDRANREAIPIGQPVAAYVGLEYGAIVYGRGAVFVRELEEVMGRETFDAFLRDYVAQFAWEIATATAFRELAETHCDCDLGQLWSEWVD